eukprot:gene7407-9102_t
MGYKIIFTIYIYVFLLYLSYNDLIFVNSTVISPTIYVNPEHGCDDRCGIYGTYNNLKNALLGAISNDNPLIVVELRTGTYKGVLNKEIELNNVHLLIGSSDLKSRETPPIIDCEGVGQVFNIKNGSIVTFNGIKFNNCSRSKGSVMSITDGSTVYFDSLTFNSSKSDFGTVFVSNSKLFVSQSEFTYNTASVEGAGIYATDSSVLELDTASVFSKNSRIVQYNNTKQSEFNDIVVRGSSLAQFTESFPANKTLYSSCSSDSSIVDALSNSLCFFSKNVVDSVGSCGDSVCDVLTEDYFSCPLDCNSTFFTGYLREEYICFDENKTDCYLHQKVPLTESSVQVFDNIDGPLKGSLNSYFTLPFDVKIYFRLKVTNNINLNVSIDRHPIIQYQTNRLNPHFTVDDQNLLEGSRYLIRDTVHQLTINYDTSLKYSEGGERKIQIEYSLYENKNFIPFDIMFFSNNTCGDGIYDPLEFNCTSDKVSGYSSPYQYLGNRQVPNNSSYALNTTCGNGVCDELDPNNCLIDCYKYITERCPPLSSRKGRIAPHRVTGDTLGVLIDNQMIWRLPGYEHFSFGFDIVFGVQSKDPIFNFGFCNEKESTIIEDAYRQVFYEVPKELSAVPVPKCTFSIENSFWSESHEMRRSKMRASSMETSANANAGIGKIGLEVEASYSQEKSVKTSQKVSSMKSGTLIESNIVCSSSNVQLNQDHSSFSLNFLSDISKAETVRDFLSLIQRYGTHYYTSAVLGGKLTQVTSTEQSTSSVEDKKSVENKVSKAMSAKVTSPVLNVQASYSDSYAKDTNEDRMREFNEASSKSSIIVYGGLAGSFGPADDTGIVSFGEWAATIDEVPIPVNYTLLPIRSRIHPSWKTPKGLLVMDQWTSAEKMYYELMLQNPNGINENPTDRPTMFWVVNIDNNQNPENSFAYIKSTYANVSTNVNLRAVPSFKFDSWADQSRDTTLFEPPFDVNWDPYSATVKFTTSLTSSNTIRSAMEGMDGASIPQKSVKNAVFIKSKNTAKFETNYIWEDDEDGPSIDFNLWEIYDFENGVLKNTSDRNTGYLLIPPMPVAYSKMAINIHIGVLIRVMYISGSVEAGKSQLITLTPDDMVLFLVASAIDYTPDYEQIGSLSSEFNWYKGNLPNPDYWYFKNEQDITDLRDEMKSRTWPDWAITYFKTCGYIKKSETETEGLKSYKVHGISSIFLPTFGSTYFFLPNNQTTNPQYIPIKISGTPQVCTPISASSTAFGESISSGIQLSLSQYSVGREFTKTTNKITVDWWFVLKIAGPANGEFMLFDSHHGSSFKDFNDKGPYKDLDSFFLKHVSPECTDKTQGVRQHWFHESIESSLKGKSLKMDPFAGQTGIVKSHAKYLISTDLDNNSGFIIDHSMQMPHFNGRSSILKDQKNAPSQHAFCLNLNGDDIKQIINLLSVSLPGLVNTNFEKQCDWEENDNSFIDQLFKKMKISVDTNQVCSGFKDSNDPMVHLTEPYPTGCYVQASIQNNLFTFLSFKPWDKGGNGCLMKGKSHQKVGDKWGSWDVFLYEDIGCTPDIKKTLKHVCSVKDFGLDSWIATANILGKSLDVSTQNQNAKLPGVDIKNTDPNKKSFAVYDIMKWTWPKGNNRHEKIGISRDTNDHTICIGDSNRVLGQLPHLGMVFCFSNENIKKGLISKLDSSRDDTNMVSEPAKPAASKSSDDVSFKRPNSFYYPYHDSSKVEITKDGSGCTLRELDAIETQTYINLKAAKKGTVDKKRKKLILDPFDEGFKLIGPKFSYGSYPLDKDLGTRKKWEIQFITKYRKYVNNNFMEPSLRNLLKYLLREKEVQNLLPIKSDEKDYRSQINDFKDRDDFQNVIAQGDQSSCYLQRRFAFAYANYIPLRDRNILETASNILCDAIGPNARSNIIESCKLIDKNSQMKGGVKKKAEALKNSLKTVPLLDFDIEIDELDDVDHCQNVLKKIKTTHIPDNN